LLRVGEEDHINETLSTLRFASRIQAVQIRPVSNVDQDPASLIKKYEEEIRSLKNGIKLHGSSSDMTELQRNQLQTKVKQFLEKDDAALEVR
jgi:kinesin family protein 6/9